MMQMQQGMQMMMQMQQMMAAMADGSYVPGASSGVNGSLEEYMQR
jgi:hypothetical protein